MKIEHSKAHENLNVVTIKQDGFKKFTCASYQLSGDKLEKESIRIFEIGKQNNKCE